MKQKSWMALVAVVFLAGCTSTTPPPRTSTASAVEGFLAGRVAQRMGDTEAAADYYNQALKFDPDNTVLLQRTFTLMVAEGNLDRAAQIADQLRLHDEDAPLTEMILGIREAKAGRFEEAESLFTTLAPSGLNDILRPLLVGWSKIGQGDLDGALNELNTNLQGLEGLDQLRDFHAAMMNDVMGHNSEAKRLYERTLTPNLTVRTVETVGNFYQRTGRMDLAEDLYARYRKAQPTSMLFDGKRMLAMGSGKQVPPLIPNAQAGLAEALFDFTSLMRQERADGATLLFARMTLGLNPDFPLAQLMVGELQTLLKQYDAAITTWQGIDKKSPIYDFSILHRAANFENQGKIEEALRTLDELVRRDALTLEAYTAKGDILRRAERYDEAITAYNAALALLPEVDEPHWTLLFSRGIVLERAGRWPEAEADLTKVLKIKPDQPDVLNYLGYSWIDQGINLEAGHALIRRAVSLSPNDGGITDSLGWALYRLGRYNEAVPLLERAAMLQPHDPTINDHLGDAYWRVGRKEEARFQWERVMTLNPDDRLKAAVEAKIRDQSLPDLPAAAPAQSESP